MRVISGTARGKKLLSPKDEKVRPTLDRVKENIFNMLGNMLGKRTLDLFSGSGALGIEALSRGADFCYFCDISRDSINLTTKNLQAVNLYGKSEVVNDDAISLIKRLNAKNEKFDFIFIDPPYADGIVKKTLQQLQKNNIMQDGGILIIETDKQEQFSDMEYGFKKIKDRVYSSSRVSLFIKEEGF